MTRLTVSHAGSEFDRGLCFYVFVYYNYYGKQFTPWH